jgi:hypothetical protein
VADTSLEIANIKKAFDLRDRVSARETFRITALYESDVTGNLEEANVASKLWVESYPQDDMPHHNLATQYIYLGELRKPWLKPERFCASSLTMGLPITTWR